MSLHVRKNFRLLTGYKTYVACSLGSHFQAELLSPQIGRLTLALERIRVGLLPSQSETFKIHAL